MINIAHDCIMSLIIRESYVFLKHSVEILEFCATPISLETEFGNLGAQNFIVDHFGGPEF